MSTEPDDLTDFTHALSAVPPDPGRLDRDALLFAAGRATGRRGVFWPATVAVLASLSAVLAGVLLTRSPTIVEVERVVYVRIPAPDPAPPSEPAPAVADDLPAPTAPSPELAAALRLRQNVLRDGVSALPRTAWTSESASSDDMPDLYSLRLIATPSDKGRFR